MTLQQINIFLCIVDKGTFSKAADHLHMTQPAISKAIQKLERDLGITLFERTTRSLSLTDSGQILYDGWKRCLSQISETYSKAHALTFRKEAVLRIGILNTARPERYFWAIEDRFEKMHPDIVLELGSEYMDDLEDRLTEGYYDAVLLPDFARFKLDKQGLSWKWAAKSKARLLMNSSHPLASRPSVSMRELENETFVAFRDDENAYTRDLLERFAPYNITPKIIEKFKTAYDIQLLFRHETESIQLIDAYFDFPEHENYSTIEISDQKNGIICAWDPRNQKQGLKKFLNCLEV